MKKHALLLLPVLFVCLVLACSKPLPPPAPETGPLTVEEWMQIPSSEKYEEQTVNRLRLNDPKLKSERAWEKFKRDVIGKEMQREREQAEAQN